MIGMERECDNHHHQLLLNGVPISDYWCNAALRWKRPLQTDPSSDSRSSPCYSELVDFGLQRLFNEDERRNHIRGRLGCFISVTVAGHTSFKPRPIFIHMAPAAS